MRLIMRKYKFTGEGGLSVALGVPVDWQGGEERRRRKEEVYIPAGVS